MKEEIERLLGGYATDTLTEEERRRLYEAALDDQEVFDALMDEQPVRELLGDADVRRELLAVLAQQPAAARVHHIMRWFGRPSGLAAAAGLATVAIAAVLLAIRVGILSPPPDLPPSSAIPSSTTRPSPTPYAGSPSPPWFHPLHTPSPVITTGELHRRLFALPVQTVMPVTMSLDRPGDPVYAPGQPWRLTFSAGHEASVLILEADAKGEVVRLFPAESGFAEVRPGQTRSIPPPWQPPRTLAAPTGERVVRLFAFPTQVDALRLTPSMLDEVQSQVSVLEIRYTVGP